MNRFASRKFLLTLMVLLAVIVGLFTKYLTGMEFLSGASLVLAMYKATNVMDQRMNGGVRAGDSR